MGDVSHHLLDFRVPDRFRSRGIQKIGRLALGLILPAPPAPSPIQSLRLTPTVRTRTSRFPSPGYARVTERADPKSCDTHGFIGDYGVNSCSLLLTAAYCRLLRCNQLLTLLTAKGYSRLTHLLVYLFTQSLTHLLTHSLTHSLTHLFTYLLAYLLS